MGDGYDIREHSAQRALGGSVEGGGSDRVRLLDGEAESAVVQSLRQQVRTQICNSKAPKYATPRHPNMQLPKDGLPSSVMVRLPHATLIVGAFENRCAS